MISLKSILEKFPNVTFYWAGDGIYRQKILDVLEKYENFKWLGSLEYPSKVRKFLSSIDIYLLLSGYDTFGMTIIEAEIMQIPVIATNVGGTSEAIINGKTGFLVNQGDVKEIEGKINLLLNDQNLAKQIGNDGRKFVIENFSWEMTVKKFIENMKNSINVD
jgi:glycosyltransferase involved in cell wall biosynthesis